MIPLGSIEQHAYLSLGVDRILSERVSVEAAEPLGVLVMPSLPYGLTPYFAAYPGSPTLRVETYCALLVDLLDSLAEQGFRRFLFVNGHGGNDPGPPGSRDLGGDARRRTGAVAQLVGRRARARGRRTRSTATRRTPPGSRTSPGRGCPASSCRDEKKPMADISKMRELDPKDVRELLGDGSLGGVYERPDEDVLRVWAGGRRGGARAARERLGCLT